MTLTELLAELRENILHDRSLRVSGDTDILWSDATLIRYINEAQRRFARRALVIRDSQTAQCCQITLVEGQTLYSLDPSVITVLSAKLDGETYDLGFAGHDGFDTYRPPETQYWDLSRVAVINPGKPRAFSLDEGMTTDDFDSFGVGQLRVYPAPDATYAGEIINLRVIRMPLYDLTTSSMCDVPEIPVEHHLEMLDWAAYLALRIVDIDAGNPARAQEFAASFEKHIIEARRHTQRKTSAPQQWSFGRNGWSW